MDQTPCVTLTPPLARLQLLSAPRRIAAPLSSRIDQRQIPQGAFPPAERKDSRGRSVPPLGREECRLLGPSRS
ncbi:hypothetical protein EYF80_059631 [Liparis tanakae]|uniref:Uncharacterized protein n=1 Tax=Liparis tanakae TaxID=230148 RepID=A0A4Z2EN59_9TELE|nr:hypothetical protein EYF80_059631 [Liparis tanakae]